MSNSVETIEVPEGTVSFDHSTGIMSAIWHNGYTETWPRRDYSIEQKFHSFLFFTNQLERYGHVTGETEWGIV